MTARPARALQLLGVSLLALSLADAAHAQAVPKGGAVVRGSARIIGGADRTVIRQSTRRAVIDWRRFDVGRDHTVVFDQPGKTSATLNRVTTARPSVIEGAIRAPGTVVIQNGAGVLFSEGATVDTGGLVATSRTVDAGRFQNTGALSLGGTGAGGAVTNRGTITVSDAGLAALVGDTVENAGTIVARQGAVVLAGGTTGTLDLAGDGVLQIAGTGSVSNSGAIDAENVVLSVDEASSALDAAINVTGTVRARDGADGGSIEVHAGSGKARIAGTLDSSGRAKGGKVTVTGRHIEATADARLAARGGDAGGIVRVGGNRGGSGTLNRAREVTVAAGAEISADATDGTGGVVIAWSDGNAQIDGSISATGGSDGGFVETSALAALQLGSNAAVTAGDGGRWLLDPRNVVIGASGATVGGGTVTPPVGSGAYTVSLATLQAALNAGTDVTVTTVQPAASMAGDITVNGALSWTGSGDLTLAAERDILIAAPVSTAAGDFTASAARSVTVAANITATGAAGVNLTAGTGDIRLARGSTGNLAVTTAAGDLTLAAGNQVTLRNWYGGLDVATGSGDLDITAGSMILARGGAGSSQWVRVGSAASSGDVHLEAPLIDVVGGIGSGSPAEVLAGSGGSLSMSAAERILIQDWTGGSRARVASLGGAPLTLEAAMQCWFGTVQSGTGSADGGPVSLSGSIAATVEPIFSLAAGNDFTLAPTTPAGDASSYEAELPLAVTTTGGGTISIDAPVTASSLTLVSAEGITLGANTTLTTTDPGDSLVVSAGGSFSNASGGDVFASGGRWLLYMDRFDSPSGTLPTPDGFDLYGRTLAGDPPGALGFAGSRIIYAEQPTLTLTADSASKTYGQAGPVIGYTAAGLRSGDSFATALDGTPTVTAGGTAANAAAGSYATSVAATASAQGYRLVLVDGSVDVAKAALTVSADDATRLYGAANPGFTASYAGFVLGEDASVLGGTLALATPATTGTNVGNYAITAAGLTSGNYTISYAPGTLTVTQAPLTVTAKDATRRYGSADPTFTATYRGLVAGDTAASLGPLALATTATVNSNVGNYAITPSGLASGNYAITYAAGTLSVTKAPLTVTASDATRRYGAANPAFGVSYAGFVAGDDASDLAGRLGFATGTTTATGVGHYAITASGLSSGNYAISWRPGTLTINPAPLTVTATDSRRTYGSAGQAFGATYDGFVNGDDTGDLAGTLRFETVATQASPVGTYGVTPTGYTNGNYAISYIAGYLTVDPAPLTVTANDASRIEGAADPDFTASYDGFVLGEGTGVLEGGLTIDADADADSPAGSYALTPGGLASGNYAITFVDGTLTVLPAPLPGAEQLTGGEDRIDAVRGVPPLTPGDASFRTTTAEAPPALDNPFALTYSLGEVVQLSSGDGATQAAATGADTQGFVPASGGGTAAAGRTSGGATDAACSGSVGLGSDTTCGRSTTRENYWTSRTSL
ncbi:MAG: MBG domain-containing protein [Amaricoccus sp.]|uniref:MBG domain-containing protein n=1 Tax=Amaricoccus sp. TaxID=1872485 RepID=UPI0039E37B25